MSTIAEREFNDRFTDGDEAAERRYQLESSVIVQHLKDLCALAEETLKWVDNLRSTPTIEEADLRGVAERLSNALGASDAPYAVAETLTIEVSK